MNTAPPGFLPDGAALMIVLFYGNTAQFGRADCAVDFFVRLYRFSVGNLTVGKEKMCNMTEQRSSKTRIRICAVLP